MRLKQNKKVFFSDIVHCYLNDKGEELIGVTSLMKKHGLGADYSGIPQDVLERAAERGSRAHRLLEDYDNGKAVEDCPILQSYKSLELQVAASEYLISDNRTVASSIDKVLEDGSLVDVKTTSELHIGALEWQLSIYAYLFERQNKGLKVPHLYALHIRDARCRPLREINRRSSRQEPGRTRKNWSSTERVSTSICWSTTSTAWRRILSPIPSRGRMRKWLSTPRDSRRRSRRCMTGTQN